jgi:hypothetical protein
VLELAARYDCDMVSGPPGFALALMVAGSAALFTLMVVKLWPNSSDAPERVGEKILRAWRRFSGIDDAAAPSDHSSPQ